MTKGLVIVAQLDRKSTGVRDFLLSFSWREVAGPKVRLSSWGHEPQQKALPDA